MARLYHNRCEKSVFNYPEAENNIKAFIKFVFKFREAGAKQNIVHCFLQEVEIQKQHVPQLIVVSPFFHLLFLRQLAIFFQFDFDGYIWSEVFIL